MLKYISYDVINTRDAEDVAHRKPIVGVVILISFVFVFCQEAEVVCQVQIIVRVI